MTKNPMTQATKGANHNMFGSWGEIAIIALAALILIGPKELPVVLRAFGRLRQKLFHVQESVRSVIDPYIHVGEVDEYQRQTQKQLALDGIDPVAGDGEGPDAGNASSSSAQGKTQSIPPQPSKPKDPPHAP